MVLDWHFKPNWSFRAMQQNKHTSPNTYRLYNNAGNLTKKMNNRARIHQKPCRNFRTQDHHLLRQSVHVQLSPALCWWIAFPLPSISIVSAYQEKLTTVETPDNKRKIQFSSMNYTNLQTLFAASKLVRSLGNSRTSGSFSLRTYKWKKKWWYSIKLRISLNVTD